VALANLDAVLQEARGALEGLPPHCLAALEAALRRRRALPASASPAPPGAPRPPSTAAGCAYRFKSMFGRVGWARVG
jgi:hypothetical protein